MTKKRREHIQSCRDNNDNSHEIIAGLYSDPSHFIYELLQNADDAGASEVVFNLTLKSLEITHNGKRLFDFHDVDSITAVGSSTKKDDVNTIGTFGSGFKSVFAITKTPSIHSGDYHFRIVDFVVPEIVEPLDIKEEYTVIDLPFNRPDISFEDAYKQISNRLQSLESESLLFLRNIQEVQWSTVSDKGHYLSETNGDRAFLISQVNEQNKQREYLVFKKNIEIDDAKLSISVAYPLDTDDGGKVIPVHDSKLFVFFPTNERTGLKFLVHAPYKTTPSRESIPFEDNQNKIITNKLSMLIAESIQSIKGKGLLDVSFLNLLPIYPENEHPLYMSAFKKVKEILTTNPLLPTSDNGYVNSKDTLLAREKELSTLLGSSDCSRLFERKSWLSTAITYDKARELRDYLTGILDIPEITMQKFCGQITDEFIKNKPDEWIVEFYANITKNKALYRESTSYQKKGILRDRPIIRLENDSHVCPENDSGDLQVYLPSKGKSKFKTVKRAIVENEESIEFLRSLGLKEPDIIDEIKEFIITKYRGNYIEKDEYIDDFERVLTIWSQSDEYRKREVADLLKQSQFIRCINQNKSIAYQKPGNVYFVTDKLLSWYKGNPDKNIYFLEIGIQLTEIGKKFLESMSVRYDLKMSGTKDIRVNRYGWYERSVSGFNPDFDIHGLYFSLNNMTIERSILLWSVLLKYANKLKGYIETKTNQNHPYISGKEKISKAMDSLTKSPWLYSKEMKLISSSIDQIAFDELNDDYERKNENIGKLVKVLGFKLDEIIEFEEKTGKKVVSIEDYELLQKIKKEQIGSKEEQEEEDIWTPETDPDDAIIIVDESSFIEHLQEDLSGQNTKGNVKNSNSDNAPLEEKKSDSNSNKPHDRKAIGDCGESIANRYLEEKFPEYEVVWLNKSGNIGKGYDFVIRENDEDIAYYEVKSKTDEAPRLFQISGTQWSWAKNLYNSKRGGMYRILLVSNVGNKEPKVREIKNPIALWNAGKLYANPVNIEL
ncbi:MAG: DUF3883 domain-containing protein [Candidatus Hatepunaea meridiana]|nr:DUF3883 domain-containing protein [Candidatus Hatepunaea meridiana]